MADDEARNGRRFIRIPKEFRNCQQAPHWQCPACGRSNWRTRLACQRCAQPHPAQAFHQAVLVEEALRVQEQEQPAAASQERTHPAAKRIRARAAVQAQDGQQYWTPAQWKEWKRQQKSTATGPSARRPKSGNGSV